MHSDDKEDERPPVQSSESFGKRQPKALDRWRSEQPWWCPAARSIFARSAACQVHPHKVARRLETRIDRRRKHWAKICQGCHWSRIKQKMRNRRSVAIGIAKLEKQCDSRNQSLWTDRLLAKTAFSIECRAPTKSRPTHKPPRPSIDERMDSAASPPTTHGVE